MYMQKKLKNAANKQLIKMIKSKTLETEKILCILNILDYSALCMLGGGTTHIKMKATTSCQ